MLWACSASASIRKAGLAFSRLYFDMAMDRNWLRRLCSALVVAATLELLLVPEAGGTAAAVSATAKEQRSATSTSAAKAASAWP